MQKSDLTTYHECFDFLIVNDGNMNIIEALLNIVAGETLHDTHPYIEEFLSNFYRNFPNR